MMPLKETEEGGPFSDTSREDGDQASRRPSKSRNPSTSRQSGSLNDNPITNQSVINARYYISQVNH